MPIKPSKETILADEVSRANPNFGHDALEAIINDTPELAEALLARELVEEVKE